MNDPTAKAIFTTLFMLGLLAAFQAPLCAGTGDSVTVTAKPAPMAIKPAQTAVIVVDMENNFAAKGGMFDRAGIDISGAQNAIAPTAKVLAAARAAGMKVIYLKMAYRPDLSDLGAADSVNRTRHLKLRGRPDNSGTGRKGKPNPHSRYVGYRNRQRTQAAGWRYQYLQNAIQRLLSDRSGQHTEKIRGQIPYHYGCHYEYLCRLNGSRRNVQRLSLRAPKRLYERTDWR